VYSLSLVKESISSTGKHYLPLLLPLFVSVKVLLHSFPPHRECKEIFVFLAAEKKTFNGGEKIFSPPPKFTFSGSQRNNCAQLGLDLRAISTQKALNFE
jgi:hypothetical protein